MHIKFEKTVKFEIFSTGDSLYQFLELYFSHFIVYMKLEEKPLFSMLEFIFSVLFEDMEAFMVLDPRSLTACAVTASYCVFNSLSTLDKGVSTWGK